MLKRLLTSYLIPVIGMGAAVLTAAPPAYATSTTTSVGTSGGYTGACTLPACDTGSGCRLTGGGIWDQWYPSHYCDGVLTQGTATCTETFRMCRDIKHYTNSNCTGDILYHEYTYQALCDGDGTAPPGGPGN